MTNTTYGPTGRTIGGEAGALADDAADVAADVADRVSGVADRVSDVASRAQEKASEFGKMAVDQVHAATDYFRDHDVNEIVSDAKSWVRAHPAQAIVAAAAIGFVVAAMLRRR